MIKYVPVTEYTDKMWYESYLTTYNKDLAFHIGMEPALVANPPKLLDFYENVTRGVEQGLFYGFGIVKDDELIGHITLDNRIGEWELGAAIRHQEHWNHGLGVKAALHAMQWVFGEKGRDWIIAFSFGKDPNVKDMILRMGFKPFANFFVLDKETWQERWARRTK